MTLQEHAIKELRWKLEKLYQRWAFAGEIESRLIESQIIQLEKVYLPHWEEGRPLSLEVVVDDDEVQGWNRLFWFRPVSGSASEPQPLFIVDGRGSGTAFWDWLFSVD